MQRPNASVIDQFGGASEHATFSSGHVFGRVKGKTGECRDRRCVCHRADGAAFIDRRQSMGRIFNDGAVMRGGNIEERIHIAWVAIEMHGDNGANSSRMTLPG